MLPTVLVVTVWSLVLECGVSSTLVRTLDVALKSALRAKQSVPPSTSLLPPRLHARRVACGGLNLM